MLSEIKSYLLFISESAAADTMRFLASLFLFMYVYVCTM